MYKKLYLILFFMSLYCVTAQTQTEIYLIGTVHKKSKILTPEILFDILEQIKPDVILQENDSRQIKTFLDDIEPDSNEQNATLWYLKKYPKTLNLPFEFEGRNEYRRKHGMVPADAETINLLDSLYQAKLLNNNEMKIYADYLHANTELKAYGNTTFKELNSEQFDSINRIRQHIQHKELQKITSENDYFAKRFVVKPDGKKISYRDGYRLWCNFWDLRNNSMAINIIRIANENYGKRIVVLTGVQHKYYIKELLKKYEDGSYTVVDYFK